MVFGDAVYMQAGGGFVKIDKHNGKVLWRVATDGGGMSGGAFSSPYFADIDGKPLALVQTRTELKGIDPESGNEAWSQPIQAFRGMNILTPTVHEGNIFTSAHTGRSQLWRVADSAASGLEEVWSTSTQAYMSSPVVVGDHLYMHLRNQRIQCVDLKTGEETWRTKPFASIKAWPSWATAF